MFRKFRIQTIRVLLAVTMLGTLLGCSDDKSKATSATQPAVAVNPAASMPPAGFEFNFSQPTFPPYFVASGLSAVEPWGRWSDSDRVIFRFGSNLPNKFVLAIAARAFGPNAGQAIVVKAGAQAKEMQLAAETTTVVKLEFSLTTATDMIEVVVPKPTVPKNGDLRTLGIAFGSIKIEPLQ